MRKVKPRRVWASDRVAERRTTVVSSASHVVRLADSLDPFARYLRFQRRHQGISRSPLLTGVRPQFERPPLLGGRWWCVDPDCVAPAPGRASQSSLTGLDGLAKS